jgi:hypothetical protein
MPSFDQMPPLRPLVNDAVLREQLAELERTGAEVTAIDEAPALPPSSARREIKYVPIAGNEIERLRRVVKVHGLELINDGAAYRCKRQRDFMVWTLAVSPLLAEERGGGEAHALQEMVRRFCE